jgi:hypothetical protein
MYPLLFFFFNKESYIKVSIKMRIEAPKGQNPSLEELNEFLQALNGVHEFIITNTQAEYKAAKKPNSFSKEPPILEYHKLNVVQICRKNPFDLEFTFYILRDGLISYWPIIKAMFTFCKKFGRNHNDLFQNLIVVRVYFDNLLSSLGTNTDKTADSFDSLNQIYNKLMMNEKFRSYYDVFCKTTLRIDQFTSNSEELNFDVDFLGDDDNANIVE